MTTWLLTRLVVPYYLLCLGGAEKIVTSCSILPTIYTDEPVLSGTIIIIYNISAEVKHVSTNPGTLKDYWKIENNSIIAAKNVSLDNDEAYCNVPVVTIRIDCGGFVNDQAVIVKEVDNYPPQFNSTTFKTSIYEGLINETVVFDLKDSRYQPFDPDCRQESADIRLQVMGGDTDALKFDSGTDQIKTNKMFDFEDSKREFTLTLMASLKNMNSTPTDFTVTVLNVLDEDPFFNNSHYVLRIPEANISYKDVWLDADPNIAATNKDAGTTETIIYSLAGMVPTNPDPKISINGTTGQLNISGDLDRETVHTYSATLKAELTNNPHRTATALLTLIVEDSNDNWPLFPVPEYSVTLQEHSPDRTLVARVLATDRDEAPNNVFNYTTVSELFSVEPETGRVLVRNSSALDREVMTSASLVVTTDELMLHAGSNPCVGNCNVTINVFLKDINDHSPVFEQRNYVFSSENRTGSHIGQIVATDDDDGDYGRVVYSLVNADEKIFYISASNGSLRLLQPAHGKNTFQVKACDEDPEARRCAQVLVEVMVTSANISSYNATVNITENAAIGTVVHSFSRLFDGYECRLNPSNSSFVIPERKCQSGVLTAADIDRERRHSYSIGIDVIQNTETKAIVSLHVLVLDENDNIPTFNSTPYLFNISKDAHVKDVIGRVAAFDPDDGNNGRLSLYFEDTEVSPLFNVSDTGEITVRQLRKWTREYLDLVLVAMDNGQPPLQATTVVKIYLGKIEGRVMFFAPAKKDDVETNRAAIVRDMSSILKVGVIIQDIVDVGTESTPSSSLSLSATRQTALQSSVPKEELRSLVESNYAELLEVFSRYREGENSSPFSLLVIILIVVAAVAVVAAVTAVSVMFYRFSGYRRRARLAENLSRQGTIYDVQEVIVDVEDERSLTDSLSTQQLLDNQPNGVAIGATNPAYDLIHENTEGQDTITQQTTVDGDEDGQSNEGTLVDISPESETVTASDRVVGSESELITDLQTDTAAESDQLASEVTPVVKQTDVYDDFTSVPPPGPVDNTELQKEGSEGVDEASTENIDDAAADATAKEDVSLEEEDVDDISDQGREVAPPTPPRAKRVGFGVEEDDISGDEDEPEPDYAKKVRFNEIKVEVIPDPTYEKENKEGDAEVQKDRPTEEIQNPVEDFVMDGTFIMTAL